MSIPHNHNNEQDRRLLVVEEHIETTNKEMGDIKVDVAGIKVTQRVMLSLVFIILAAIVGLFLK